MNQPDIQRDLQPDEQIDRVLAALNGAQPAPGMEARIRANLETAPVHPSRSAWQTLIPWVAAFAVLPIAFFLFVAHNRRPLPARVVADVVPHDVSPSPELPVTRPMQGPQRPHVGRAVLRTVLDASRVPARAHNAALEPSFPAPPLPLTAQERLLLKVASQGEPTAAPTLDPDRLASQEAQNEARFQQRISQPSASQLVAARSADVEQLSSSLKLTGDRP